MADAFLIGLDLGQATDYTALAVVQRLDPTDAKQRATYHLRHLERPALGTPYPEIVRRVATLTTMAPLSTARVFLVVDATGVGRPVIDLLHQARLNPVAVTITAGNAANRTSAASWTVPKRDLVAAVLVLLQAGRLQIAAGLPLADVLATEMLNFRAKISLAGADTYEAWRDGQHDDVLLALSLACWYGETAIKRALISFL